MIEQVRNIGKYVTENFPEENPLDAMLNKIEGDKLKTILEINVLNNDIKTTLKDFRREVVKDALFYQKGNGALGGGIRLDFYKDSKVKSACDFCEISEKFIQIKSIIEKYIAENGSDTFAIILSDGKTPRELFQDKFLAKMYSTMYKEIDGEHFCHICGSQGKVFNTTSFLFYTNDKEIYSNINSKEKTGVVICGTCLNSIIVGKKYINETLRTYWKSLESEVMFLPHIYNKEIAKVYKSAAFIEKEDIKKLIDAIKISEEDVLDKIGKTNSVTDILFFEEQSKFFYIYHAIQSVLPSVFTKVSLLLKRYELRLFSIFMYTAAVKVYADRVETSSKEKIRVLDAVMHRKKISRNLFFKRAMDVYRHYYLKGEDRKYACMRTINRIYGFLCECGCLEKRCDVMEEYKDYGELFEKNMEYFDSNEKKAWFILGKAYSTMIYYITPSSNNDGDSEKSGKESIKSSLEKNFFFSRKFDFKDFVYFSNLLEEKSLKYSLDKPFFKGMMCEAKEMIGKRESKLSQDESKYVFFWGFNSYFKKDKSGVNSANIEGGQENGKD